jgi:hypothetical protein
MGALELKSDLHKILDKIENEQLLRTIYDFLTYTGSERCRRTELANVD